MRPVEETVEQAELRKDFHRRGMNGVTPEIAKEVAMLLEHRYCHPGAGEEQARHHSRRAAADYDHIRPVHAVTLQGRADRA